MLFNKEHLGLDLEYGLLYELNGIEIELTPNLENTVSSPPSGSPGPIFPKYLKHVVNMGPVPLSLSLYVVLLYHDFDGFMRLCGNVCLFKK